ncbi:MAG: hypothetical protein A3E84_05305 [Gammaproteobacteria bacterium RIFCSPHIGHO2_12_FULL_42_13]|nr:MAG: hypothetical protein A3E84_05305 [Gammaproteobacteria bacterium RIFCSPHIGHO2_12_FULL_42_13]
MRKDKGKKGKKGEGELGESLLRGNAAGYGGAEELVPRTEKQLLPEALDKANLTLDAQSINALTENQAKLLRLFIADCKDKKDKTAIPQAWFTQIYYVLKTANDAQCLTFSSTYNVLSSLGKKTLWLLLDKKPREKIKVVRINDIVPAPEFGRTNYKQEHELLLALHEVGGLSDKKLSLLLACYDYYLNPENPVSQSAFLHSKYSLKIVSDLIHQSPENQLPDDISSQAFLDLLLAELKKTEDKTSFGAVVSSALMMKNNDVLLAALENKKLCDEEMLQAMARTPNLSSQVCDALMKNAKNPLTLYMLRSAQANLSQEKKESLLRTATWILSPLIVKQLNELCEESLRATQNNALNKKQSIFSFKKDNQALDQKTSESQILATLQGKIALQENNGNPLFLMLLIHEAVVELRTKAPTSALIKKLESHLNTIEKMPFAALRLLVLDTMVAHNPELSDETKKQIYQFTPTNPERALGEFYEKLTAMKARPQMVLDAMKYLAEKHDQSPAQSAGSVPSA